LPSGNEQVSNANGGVPCKINYVDKSLLSGHAQRGVFICP
jgi:hypothetical protein